MRPVLRPRIAEAAITVNISVQAKERAHEYVRAGVTGDKARGYARQDLAENGDLSAPGDESYA